MIARSGTRVLRRVGRASLMPVAALAVHQLRYTLAFGGKAGIALSRQGHAYLHSLAPWIVLLIAGAVGAFLWALGRAVSGQRTPARYGLSLLGLWAVCAACLVAMYIAQESLEGVLATGHPLGLAGIFGYGGWWAVPAALCIGLVLATIFHGARWVLDEVSARHRRRAPAPVARHARAARWCAAPLPRLVPLAAGWSGRGPPV